MTTVSQITRICEHSSTFSYC